MNITHKTHNTYNLYYHQLWQKYMNNFEEQVIKNFEYKKEIKKWVRYVDDNLGSGHC